MPAVLYDAMEDLRRERGYKSISRFFVGLGLLSVQDARRPKWVAHIANAKPILQDFLIEKMLGFPIDDLDAIVEQLKRLDR